MIIKTAKRLESVQEYYFSRKLKEIRQMKAEGADILNLGIGSPDLAPAKAVIQRLCTESQQANNHQYQSYQGIMELREAFARFYKKWYKTILNPATEILPLMGSKEGIMHIAMTFLEQGDAVLVPNPGYPTYQSACRLAGAEIVPYILSEENNWLPDLKALAQQDLSNVKIMWLNYPHMPTGGRATQAFFEEVVAFAKKHQILLCHDNPYSFILNNELRSILSVEGAKEVAIELNSLSKAHNMAGWRIGMLAAKETYLKAILRFKSNMDSGMFKPLQLAAVAALEQEETWYRELNTTYKKRRQKVFDLLDNLNCTYDADASGLFVWAKVPVDYANGRELSDKLLYEAHVFVPPGEIFGTQGEPYIRVSLCNTEAVFEEAMERIKRAFFLLKN